MMRQRSILLVVVVAVAACDATGSPSELDRARILAVRVDPPHLAAGEVGRVDVLVGGDDGRVAVVAPEEVSAVTAPVEMIARDATGWQVRAPGDAEIAAMRAALALPADALVPVSISIAVAVEGEPLTAQKSVHLGAAGGNPTVGTITFGGVPAPADRIVIPAGDVALLADPIVGEGELTYAWYSSVGDLERYARQDATLTALAGYQGQIAFVVRDETGGVVWTWANVVVE